MGLRDIMRNAAVTAFKALGDIPRPVTYQSLTGTVTRDLVDGTVTADSVSYTIPPAGTAGGVIFAKFDTSEDDANVAVSTDEKMSFPTIWLPVTPKTSDLVLDENDREWEIVRLLTDPADAVTVLHVRTSRNG